MQKLVYFRLFCKEITKPRVKFSRVWTKNTNGWENFEKILKGFNKDSIEKLNFYLFLGKIVARNRNFGNHIILLQQFFPVRGGGLNPPPNPLCTPLISSGLFYFIRGIILFQSSSIGGYSVEGFVLFHDTGTSHNMSPNITYSPPLCVGMDT